MRSKVEVAGHALHPMLIAFPLGLLGLSPLWDILRLATDNATWSTVAFWTITAGVVSGLVAAVPGFVDWLAIPAGTRAKAVGTWHMVLNLLVVGLFGLSLALRATSSGGYVGAGAAAMLPGWVGMVLAVFSAWFGGELVETLGIGVHEGAHANHRSSLRTANEGPAER
jgi:uncharacterized membrane protein